MPIVCPVIGQTIQAKLQHNHLNLKSELHDVALQVLSMKMLKQKNVVFTGMVRALSSEYFVGLLTTQFPEHCGTVHFVSIVGPPGPVNTQ